MRNQTTIAKEVTLRGKGLHTGESVRISLLPAEADSGIRFTRTDTNLTETLRADPFCVSSTERGTVLQSSAGTEIRTVEHLMAACYGLQIDNLLVQVEGPELPSGDGSALPFVEALSQAGKRPLTRPRQKITLETSLWVAEGENSLVALPVKMPSAQQLQSERNSQGEPSPHLEITFLLHYPHPQVGFQRASFAIDETSFREGLSPARTFGFIEEVEQLHSAGLALGASEENVLAIYPDGFSSPPRFPDEPVRHKILDLIGDLALLGADLQCRIVALKSGHQLNNKLARTIAGHFQERLALSNTERGTCLYA